MCSFVVHCIHTRVSASKATIDRMRKKELCRGVAIVTSLVCFDWQMRMPMPKVQKAPLAKHHVLIEDVHLKEKCNGNLSNITKLTAKLV